MREFEAVIDDAFKNCLSPYPVPFNQQFLSECVGLRCGKYGLEPAKTFTNPLPSSVDLRYSWPFPQFISGEKYNFLIIRDDVVNHEDIVYLVSDDHQTLTHVFSIDEWTFGVGTLADVADFGKYALFTKELLCYIMTQLSMHG